MTACNDFRARFDAVEDDPKLLSHLRACDSCLDFTAHANPELMFRAIGGEMTPPGGTDAFVTDVMHSIQLRSAESSIAHVPAWPRKLALAAALAATVSGATLMSRWEMQTVPSNPVVARQASLPKRPVATKPAVESYSSKEATILEVPTDKPSQVRIVMVIDDKLPADL